MKLPADRYAVLVFDSRGNAVINYYHQQTRAQAWRKFDTLESIQHGRCLVVEYREVAR